MLHFISERTPAIIIKDNGTNQIICCITAYSAFLKRILLCMAQYLRNAKKNFTIIKQEKLATKTIFKLLIISSLCILYSCNCDASHPETLQNNTKPTNCIDKADSLAKDTIIQTWIKDSLGCMRLRKIE